MKEDLSTTVSISEDNDHNQANSQPKAKVFESKDSFKLTTGKNSKFMDVNKPNLPEKEALQMKIIAKESARSFAPVQEEATIPTVGDDDRPPLFKTRSQKSSINSKVRIFPLKSHIHFRQVLH